MGSTIKGWTIIVINKILLLTLISFQSIESDILSSLSSASSSSFHKSTGQPLSRLLLSAHDNWMIRLTSVAPKIGPSNETLNKQSVNNVQIASQLFNNLKVNGGEKRLRKNPRAKVRRGQCNNPLEVRVDAVLWPPYNRTNVWLFRGNSVFLFDIEKKKLFEEYKTESLFPAITGLTQGSYTIGSSASRDFTNKSSRFFYSFIAISKEIVQIYVHKHEVDPQIPQLTEGIPMNDSPFNLGCHDRGLISCFLVSKYIPSGMNEFFYYYRANSRSEYRPYKIACKSGIHKDGKFRRKESVSSNRDPEECSDGHTLLDKGNSYFAELQEKLTPGNSRRCTAVDMPMFDAASVAEPKEIPYVDSYIFWVQGHKVHYRTDNIEGTTLTVAQVFGCTEPFQKSFNFYQAGIYLSLFLFFSFALILSFTVLKDLGRLGKIHGRGRRGGSNVLRSKSLPQLPAPVMPKLSESVKKPDSSGRPKEDKTGKQNKSKEDSGSKKMGSTESGSLDSKRSTSSAGSVSTSSKKKAKKSKRH